MRLPHLPRRMTVPGALAISALIAACFAVWSLYTISLLPPGIEARKLAIGTAATHVLVDAPKSLITDAESENMDFESYTKRATLFANLMASQPVRELIARRMDVPAGSLATVSRLTEGVQRNLREPDSEQRASQILVSDEPYRLDVQPDPVMPVIDIYAQAPSGPEAVRLANAAVAGLTDYLRTRAVRDGETLERQLDLTQLGQARGDVVNAKTPPQLVLLTFLVAFGIALAVLLGAQRVRRGWREAGGGAEPAGDAHPAHAHRGAGAWARRGSPRERVRALADAGGDWPHTTRVLPWMIAGFMVVLWMVPFNRIQLAASLPIDLKFDRLVLPLLFATWVLALAAGGRAAPRLRLTLIHVGIAGFIAVTCLGIVVDQHYLNQTLEFDLAFKKLTLLFSYGLFFLIVASSVRRSEVPAFFTFTLGLSVACALGIVWEFRFQYNPFQDLSDKLLPGFFQVSTYQAGQYDSIGRLLTLGPADHPLETVGMVSMGLPIALVGIVHSSERRSRILYGLAACIILAASLSTYRKSALMAPVSVAFTIAYFRRSELLRLAPLAALALVVVHALSPGALGAILAQLQPGRLGVGTVSDRASDYDAVRPDLWTHLLFGRGYGTYDHISYRVLDSEILNRIVDTGVLGLLSFFLMLVAIVFAASGTIRSRHPVWAPPALAVAAAAVAYMVLAFLFDVSSFPHTPYILMSLAGLLAVIVSPPEEEAAPPRPADRHGVPRRIAPQQRRPAPAAHISYERTR